MKVSPPIRPVPLGRIGVPAVATGGGALAIHDQFGRELVHREFARGEALLDRVAAHSEISRSRERTVSANFLSALSAWSLFPASGTSGTRRVSLSWATRASAET